MSINWVPLTLSLTIFLLTVELVRRERLTFKYAFGWMSVAFLGVIVSIFDSIVFQISAILGFELPSNFIFFGILTCFVFLSLMLTMFLCKQDKNNSTIAQKIAHLEYDLNQLKEKDREAGKGRET